MVVPKMRDTTPTMENQMERKLENEMEAAVYKAICSVQDIRRRSLHVPLPLMQDGCG